MAQTARLRRHPVLRHGTLGGECGDEHRRGDGAHPPCPTLFAKKTPCLLPEWPEKTTFAHKRANKAYHGYEHDIPHRSGPCRPSTTSLRFVNLCPPPGGWPGRGPHLPASKQPARHGGTPPHDTTWPHGAPPYFRQSSAASRRGTERRGQSSAAHRRGTEWRGQSSATHRRGTERRGQSSATHRRDTERRGQSSATSRRGTEWRGQSSAAHRRGTERRGQSSARTGNYGKPQNNTLWQNKSNLSD